MFEIIVSYIFVLISVCGAVEVYRKVSGTMEKVYSIKNIIKIGIFSVVQMILALSYYENYKLLFVFVLLYLLSLSIFKEDYKTAFVRVFLIQIMEMIIELVFSLFLVIASFKTIEVFDTFLWLKNLSSLFIALVMILLANIKIIRKPMRTLTNIIVEKESKVLEYIILIFYAFIATALSGFIFNINKENFIANTLFLVLTLVCIYSVIKNYKKVIKYEEKQKVLLEFMKKYEYLIEKDRINRHEMLNNLIILNSYKDKNGVEFQKEINDLINTYSESKNVEYKNIGHLPSGIKGVLYYKISDMEMYGINYTFYASKEINKYLSSKTKEYTRCSKMLGIFLDNAIEAARKSEEKKVIIDIYLSKDSVHFYIENSIGERVDVKSINKKNYTTKGKGRGLGLFIANKIKKETNNITYSQEVKNGMFITELIVKVK